MGAIKIEILNPKALEMIELMQDLKLIKVSEEPISNLKKYLETMRSNSENAPTLDEITEITEMVRSERYAKK
ncbi:hypothetical protein [Cognataquiflexum rubidum]|jgi:hypothetical protein|uniref:hypothetical protein n=1 Tax=Cognataquiflexum rubidum TaxID=2922273 RepID=UPI001F12BE44|nr:hypothetical protein [Cognataquiflexum rubidum]MCH6234075.1 hypothetical protein [Cognataquiflexum rubidum]